MLAVAYPLAFSTSTKVLALVGNMQPLYRSPCSDGILPVIKLARLGMQIGVAT